MRFPWLQVRRLYERHCHLRQENSNWDAYIASTQLAQAGASRDDDAAHIASPHSVHPDNKVADAEGPPAAEASQVRPDSSRRSHRDHTAVQRSTRHSCMCHMRCLSCAMHSDHAWAARLKRLLVAC